MRRGARTPTTTSSSSRTRAAPSGSPALFNTPREGVARSRLARKPMTSVLFTLGRRRHLRHARPHEPAAAQARHAHLRAGGGRHRTPQAARGLLRPWCTVHQLRGGLGTTLSLLSPLSGSGHPHRPHSRPGSSHTAQGQRGGAWRAALSLDRVSQFDSISRGVSSQRGVVPSTLMYI